MKNIFRFFYNLLKSIFFYPLHDTELDRETGKIACHTKEKNDEPV